MTSYCGYIALIGRPNVGKSTLLNRVLEQKVSITSRKPQTTRHRILGIHTTEEYQFVFVDTPGIHRKLKNAMNRLMNQAAVSVLHDVDIIAFLVDGTQWKEEDEDILELIKTTTVPCILLINKVDKLKDKDILLPFIKSMKKKYKFAAIIPISARTGVNVDGFLQEVKALLPEGPHLFADDQVTDRSTRFLCAELIREKIFRLCGQELPYATTVEIESFQATENVIRVHALILVDRESHKRMIIGEKGSKLKEMASQARIDIEHLLDKKVFLRCWCKVKSGWADDQRTLTDFGYEA